jgi:hypothetical protein
MGGNLYKDITRYSVFLCRECLLREWRKRHLLFAVPCFVGGFVLSFMLLACGFLGGGNPLGVLAFAAAILMLGAGISVVPLWKACFPRLKKGVVDQIVVNLACPYYTDKGDTFWTPAEYAALAERFV